MAEPERHFLGLTHNPFTPPQSGFFERGGRRRHLEQLRHLSEWSRRVLLVTGPEGAGKTMLFRELAATLEPRVKAARINGVLVNSGREVLAAVGQGFGLAVPANASMQMLRQMLRDHVEEQSARDRQCLALIDDAQLLDSRAVSELMSLTHDCALHLVMFGEPRLAPTIERAASSKGVGWQEISLTGYASADAREYLEWRFQQARYRGRVPFTDQQVSDLIRESGGLPGRLDVLANELLVRLEHGESARKHGVFPRQHAALLGLALVLLGLLYVVVGGDMTESTGAPDAGAEDVAMARDRGTSAGEAAVSGEPEPVSEPERPEAGAEETPEAMSGAETLSAEPADGASGSGPAAVERPDRPAGAGTEEPSAAPEEPSAAPEELSAALEPETDRGQGDREPVADAAESVPGRFRDGRWLLAQNPDAYTLQLVTVSALERAEAFVARQQDPDEFTIFQLERDGRVLHVVLMGLYPTRGAAEAASDALPPEVGDVKPWIRPLAHVQAVARLSGPR